MSYDIDDNISLGYCSDAQQFSPDSYHVTWPLSDTNSGAWIDFVEQPADYRYRYLKEKYHGHIVGVSSPATKKKDMCKFPKVKLHNHHGSAIIKVWLITTELDKPRAHFHKLARKTPKGVLNLEPHVFIASEQNNFEVTLDYLHIVHAVSSDENDINVYRKKKAHIQSGFYDCPQTIPTSTKEEKEEIKQIDKNQSVFYIQVFDEKTQTKICESVSRKIKNLHNAETGALRIVNCSRTFGTCRGGDEVFIFVEKISKDVEVRFFKEDDNKERIWEAPAVYGPHNVHHQLGIVFKTPKFQQEIQKDSQVFFELHRKNDGAVSVPRSFTYKPHEDYKLHEVGKKRPHSPEIMSSEDEYLPSVVTSFGSKRMKDESMSPDSTTIPLQTPVENIYHQNVNYEFYNPVNTSEIEYYGDDFSTLITNDLDPNLNDDYMLHSSEVSVLDLQLLGCDASLLTTDSVSPSVVNGNIEDTNKNNVTEHRPISSDEISQSHKIIKTVPNSDQKKSSHSPKVNLQMAISQKKPIEEINEILKSINNINCVDYEGNSALHYAAGMLSTAYLECLLLQKDIDNSIRNLWGDDVLLFATRKANIAAIRFLLKKNFEPNVQNSRTGETPLHLALADNNYAIVELLLKFGADPLINNHSNLSSYEYSLNCGSEIKKLTYISMQRNMFKQRRSLSQPSCSVEYDLVGKLNELVVSTT